MPVSVILNAWPRSDTVGKDEKSPGTDWLFHERDLPHRPRLSAKAVRQVMDSIKGIISDMTQGREGQFVPISIYEVRLELRTAYDMFLTYRQVGYFMRRLVREGVFEKEVHNVDRKAQHWSNQYSRYRFK